MGETLRNVTLRTQLLYGESSLVSALLGVVFGHRHLRTSSRQTFLRGFLERVYRNNLRRLGELKHKTDHAISNTDPKVFHKARNTPNMADARLRGCGENVQRLL